MKLSQETYLDFNDVLIKPKRSIAESRSVIDMTREFRFYHSDLTWQGLPIIAANMGSTGSVAMAEALSKYRAITCLHKFNKTIPASFVDSPYVWISTGMSDSDTLKYWEMCPRQDGKENPLFLCIDVANGYTTKFCDTVSRYRDRFPNAVIMAGNVATPEMVQELIISGADIIKIGIGSGISCMTRMVTGVGISQLSAILECADVAHGLKKEDKRLGLICSDGGIRTPGDICKSFCAGADFIMIGGLLSGTDECEGEWIQRDDEKYLKFFGMASYEAQNQYIGGSADYRATEGKIVYSKHKGPVKNIMKEIIGGIRSCCSYIGATDIKSMNRCGSFVRVNRVHDTPEWRIE